MGFELDRSADAEELKQLAAPLVNYLREKHRPHTAIVVTDTRVVLTENVMGIPFPFEEDAQVETHRVTRTDILISARDVFDTTDVNKMAAMVESQNWVMVNSHVGEDQNLHFCLIRIS